MKYLLTNQQTERLHFRLLQDSDFDEWTKLFYNKDAARFLGMDPSLSPKELCQSWFDKSFKRYEDELGGMNVLVDKQSGRLIGQCGLLIQTIQDEQRMEIGYSILPEFWGQGFATEAAVKHKNVAFENNYTDSLISVIHPENIGSEKVALKNGMQVEKFIDDYKGMPVRIFCIKKNDWLSQA